MPSLLPVPTGEPFLLLASTTREHVTFTFEAHHPLVIPRGRGYKFCVVLDPTTGDYRAAYGIITRPDQRRWMFRFDPQSSTGQHFLAHLRQG